MPQEALGVAVRVTDTRVNEPARFLAELALVDEVIDIISIALAGGDTPRRGVRLIKQPEIAEIRHLVSHGGGGNGHIKRIKQSL